MAIFRTAWHEQADGSLTCTLTITPDELGKLVAAGISLAPNAPQPLSQAQGDIQAAMPDGVYWDEPPTEHPEAATELTQTIGVGGFDSQSVLMPSAQGERLLSLALLSRHAPFQRFVESIGFKGNDSEHVAAQAIAASHDKLRMMDEYMRWHTTQPFAAENPLPDYLFT